MEDIGKIIQKHEQEISELKSDVHNLKEDINRRLGEILQRMKDEAKPQFSLAQVFGFLLSLILAIASFVVYTADIKKEGEKREIRINYLEKMDSKKDLQYENIMSKLNEIDKKVAVSEIEHKKLIN